MLLWDEIQADGKPELMIDRARGGASPEQQ
jgi:hypothetical protein